MKLGFDISKIEGFEWDRWNIDKNKIKHGVEKKECEEAFLNQPLEVFDDEVHSKTEIRYGALGKTSKGRKLTIFFTVRKNKIRVISAYDQGKKDRKLYLEIEKEFEKGEENEKIA